MPPGPYPNIPLTPVFQSSLRSSLRSHEQQRIPRGIRRALVSPFQRRVVDVLDPKPGLQTRAPLCIVYHSPRKGSHERDAIFMNREQGFSEVGHEVVRSRGVFQNLEHSVRKLSNGSSMPNSEIYNFGLGHQSTSCCKYPLSICGVA